MIHTNTNTNLHWSCIEPEERHLKDLRFGDNGDGKRGDVRVCTHEDLLNVDIVGLHPASKTHRSTAYIPETTTHAANEVGNAHSSTRRTPARRC